MNVLITAPYNREGREELQKQFGNIIYKPWKTHGRGYNENELIALLSEHNAEALITEHDHVTDKVIDSNPKLNFIGVCRGTPSNVNLEAAERHNIPVFNAPGRNAQAVAELFIANVISLMRKTEEAMTWLKSGEWEEGSHTAYLQFKGSEMAGKTVGLIGFGAVGKSIARMLNSFPCNILYYDPFVIDVSGEYEAVEIEKLFRISDIVSINLPVNEETRGMIDKKLISLMKSEAIFVNMARAATINQRDLTDALKSEKIRGAVLDVYNNEPPDKEDYELIHLPNVLATPHIAGATHEVEDHHVRIMNKKIIRHFSSGTNEDGTL